MSQSRVKQSKIYPKATHTSIQVKANRNTQIADRAWSRLKGMSRKNLINIQTTDVRHRVPKICSAALKMMTVDREVILSKLCCSKDLKSSAVRFQRYIYGYVFVLRIPSLYVNTNCFNFLGSSEPFLVKILIIIK